MIPDTRLWAIKVKKDQDHTEALKQALQGTKTRRIWIFKINLDLFTNLPGTNQWEIEKEERA